MRKFVLFCTITALSLIPCIGYCADEETASPSATSEESTPAVQTETSQEPQLQESPQQKDGIPYAVDNTAKGVVGFIKNSLKNMGELPGIMGENISKGMDADQQHESHFGITQ